MGSRIDVHQAALATTGAGSVTLRLPWDREPGERLRLGLSLLLFLALFVPLAIWIPRIDLPEPDRQTREQVPPQLARLIQEKPEPKPVVQPEPEKPKPEVKPQPEPKPAPKHEPVARPGPKPKPAVAAEPAKQTVEQARTVAAKSGLMALSDDLSAMQSLAAEPGDTGLSANVDTRHATAAKKTAEPDALQRSGGVQDVRGPTEQVALAEHQVKQVAAPEPARKPQTRAKAAPDPGPEERSMANIRRVFDQQKSVLFSLYNRELRKNPALEGEVLLEVTVEPDGHVSNCRIVSSELDAPGLEQKILMRVRLFNFGAADVETRRVRFPINFLPS
ncbi:TonB family protein [Marinobacter halodurans]|uniref:TonB family protein n=1 Tax=Marinobacter halodurans TaxID=2528979 RepID=A0ABY1ZHU0_9GAMM|nr:AgmX/PglI C-terminal domain-containing protein [Marinobacter halodurans]TBW50151.1 TonB family protein [Marinobacter halodurans]